MARQSEGPWFRSGTGGWYATVGGKAVSLGVRGESSRPDALRAWHRLMAGAEGGTTTPPPSPVAEAPAQVREVSAGAGSKPPLTVRGLAGAYLADAPGRMSAACLRNYRCFFEPFAGRFGQRNAETLTPQEAESYARRLEWSSTYRANFLTAVGAVYRWALRERMISTNPMLSLRKPVRESRGTSAVMTADEHARLLANARPDTKDLLTVLWATGG